MIENVKEYPIPLYRKLTMGVNIGDILIGKVLLGSIVLLTAVFSASFVGYGVITGDMISDGHHHHGRYFENEFKDHCMEEGNIYCSQNETEWCNQEGKEFCQVDASGECFEYNEECLEVVGTCHRG